ncbi:MAG: phosphoenolpyruvate carboxykinase, partial [Lentisphaerae bacterium]|nr:phosphoenolpyruvate carboxykinase [Lentisphaerota bacterium]
MEQTDTDMLKGLMDEASWQKLSAINNAEAMDFIVSAARLCEPDAVFVADDSEGDAARIRQMTVEQNEERPLSTEGHTIHFDGYQDQARKKEVTKYLVPEGETLDDKLNQTDRESGLKEIEDLQRGGYQGRTMLVRFFCLGPPNTIFGIPCLQITDSAYVAHSEDLLYRKG